MKKLIKYISIFTAIILLMSAGAFLAVKQGFIDLNSDSETETSYDNDENTKRSYALVELDKSILEASEHKLIETISPILLAYSDKYYTTFIFDDGTGLYFPESDINNTAFYGQVNEYGIITTEFSYYTIKGTNVSIEEAKAYASEESKEMMQYYPKDMQSDDSWVTVYENDLYLIMGLSEDSNLSTAYDLANELYQGFIDAGAKMSDFNNVYISIGDIYGFVADPKSEEYQLINNNDILDKFEQIF